MRLFKVNQNLSLVNTFGVRERGARHQGQPLLYRKTPAPRVATPEHHLRRGRGHHSTHSAKGARRRAPGKVGYDAALVVTEIDRHGRGQHIGFCVTLGDGARRPVAVRTLERRAGRTGGDPRHGRAIG
jgi:hypothetical protein